MQGNGAEMLRLACCFLTEAGIQVCAPVHDAVLVEGSEEHIDAIVSQTGELMTDASRIVLDGFVIRTDAKLIRHPDRYMDPRGQRMWDTITGIMDELDDENIPASGYVGNPLAGTFT